MADLFLSAAHAKDNASTDDDACQEDGTCSGVDYCIGVTCDPPPTECRLETACAHGLCLDHPRKADGVLCNATNPEDASNPCLVHECRGGECVSLKVPDYTVACDDSDNSTGDDFCVSGRQNIFEVKWRGEGEPSRPHFLHPPGVCIGTPLCANVTCPPSGQQCRGAPTCRYGQCVYPQLPAGAFCDDGNASTINDVCDASGVCAGVDACLGVMCDPPPDECQ